MRIHLLWGILAVLSNEPLHAETLSFEQALRTILSKDTNVTVAEANKRALEGQNFSKRFHLLPKIAVEGTDGRTSSGQKSTSAVRTSSLYGTAEMSLFHFGADQASLNAARASEKGAEFALEQTRLESEKTAIEKLVTLIRLSQETAILTQLEKMQADTVEVGKRQFNSGRVPIQEVQKAEIDLQNVRSRIGESEIRLTGAREEVTRLLGTAEVEVTWPWKELIKNSKVDSISADALLLSRPDFLAVSQQVEAQNQLKKQAFRSMLPELGAKVTYGWGRDAVDPEQFNTGWSGILQLQIPIFNRFQNYSNFRFQSATLEAVEASRTEVDRRIRAQSESIPKQFLEAKKTAISRDQILQMSSRLYQDNLSRYKLGKATSNELNIDLNRYLETELNAISGWALAHNAYCDWLHLSGKSVLTQ